MNESPIPILTIELQQAAQTIKRAIMTQYTEIDNLIENAVANFNIESYVNDLVSQRMHVVLKEVIDQQLKDYFVYGDGKRTVQQAIRAIVHEDDEENDGG